MSKCFPDNMLQQSTCFKWATCSILHTKLLISDSLLVVTDQLPFVPGLDVDRSKCGVASSKAHYYRYFCWSLFYQTAPVKEKSTALPSQYVLLPSRHRCPEGGHDTLEWLPHCQTEGHIPPWSHGQLMNKPDWWIQFWTRSKIGLRCPVSRSNTICLHTDEHNALQTVLEHSS